MIRVLFLQMSPIAILTISLRMHSLGSHHLCGLAGVPILFIEGFRPLLLLVLVLVLGLVLILLLLLLLVIIIVMVSIVALLKSTLHLLLQGIRLHCLQTGPVGHVLVFHLRRHLLLLRVIRLLVIVLLLLPVLLVVIVVLVIVVFLVSIPLPLLAMVVLVFFVGILIIHLRRLPTGCAGHLPVLHLHQLFLFFIPRLLFLIRFIFHHHHYHLQHRVGRDLLL